MDKRNDNARSDSRKDEIEVFGAVSVETKGPAGTGEPLGKSILPGIAQE